MRRFGRTYPSGETVPANACKVTRDVLAEFFEDGLYVCIEITLMAADSGELPLGEGCMAIATPCGYPHTAPVGACRIPRAATERSRVPVQQPPNNAQEQRRCRRHTRT